MNCFVYLYLLYIKIFLFMRGLAVSRLFSERLAGQPAAAPALGQLSSPWQPKLIFNLELRL
jgi:hypothetical protein